MSKKFILTFLMIVLTVQSCCRSASNYGDIKAYVTSGGDPKDLEAYCRKHFPPQTFSLPPYIMQLASDRCALGEKNASKILEFLKSYFKMPEKRKQVGSTSSHKPNPHFDPYQQATKKHRFERKHRGDGSHRYERHIAAAALPQLLNSLAARDTDQRSAAAREPQLPFSDKQSIYMPQPFHPYAYMPQPAIPLDPRIAAAPRMPLLPPAIPLDPRIAAAPFTPSGSMAEQRIKK